MVCVCVWMTADSRCRGCPEPPLTQPTMLLSLGYPAMLRETSRNLEGSEFIWVHGRGRRQGKCTERKQEEEATRTWVRQDKWEEGECWEGWNKRKEGWREREGEWFKSKVITWRKSSHLPAASLGQQRSDARMLPCAASTSWAVCLSECACVLKNGCCRAPSQHKDQMHNLTDFLRGTSLQNASPVTIAPPSTSRQLSQTLNSLGKPLKNIALSLLPLAGDA